MTPLFSPSFKFITIRDSSSIREMHAKRKTFQCEVCNAELVSKQGLELHMFVHNNLKETFTCEICDKTFNQSFKLKKHMIVHSGEKPFKCESCGSDFARKQEFGIPIAYGRT